MNAIEVLKAERDKLQKDVNRLNAAINALRGSASIGRTTINKRPTLSPAARARIAAAQRARWAKVRATGGETQNVVSVPAKKKIMSPAARRKIAAAQRARWAKVRAKKGKSKR
jgi:hypothetical protein